MRAASDPAIAGLSPSDWVAVGIFLAGAMGTFLWWLWQRFLKQVEKLHDDIHGREGVVAHIRVQIEGIKQSLGVFVSEEDLDVQLRDLQGSLKEIRQDGQRREQTMLEALKGMEQRSREDNNQLRKDIGDIHKRIDHAFQRRPPH